MKYAVTDRLAVDTDLDYRVDVGRACMAINTQRIVYVEDFDKVVAVMRALGMADPSIRIIIEKSLERNGLSLEELLKEAKALAPGKP